MELIGHIYAVVALIACLMIEGLALILVAEISNPFNRGESIKVRFFFGICSLIGAGFIFLFLKGLILLPFKI